MRSGTASPGRYINTGWATYLPVTMQRLVPTVLRASRPVWTRTTVTVVCTRLVFRETMHLALCSLPWLAGPECSAFWPVWTRRTVMRFFLARLFMLVTMHLALCSLPWLAGLECSAFWPVWTRRAVARGVQAIGFSGRWLLWVSVFSAQLGSIVDTCTASVYGTHISRYVSVFSAQLGSTADTCGASVYEAFLEEFHTFFYVKGGLSDPEVDPRPSVCCKLWTLRSCSSSLSSTSLSLRTGRFPWSLRFSSCSTLTRWSTAVVQVSLHARCVHRQMPWWTSL